MLYNKHVVKILANFGGAVRNGRFRHRTAELAAERLLGADRGPASSMHVTLMSSIPAGRAARFAAPWASDKAAHVVISDATGAPCYDVRLGYGG